MKGYNILFLLMLTVLAQACGQTGPLYLPGSPPPVHVPKEAPVEEL
ncbi:MAG: LPS translocon maturation chaperone LptM [Gammaproteobacteria bacterium]